ncbi:MAG: 3-keto-5-aminohexanoate cleavage enzyme, partial [uncultured Thermomicrobiales bacterium]
DRRPVAAGRPDRVGGDYWLLADQGPEPGAADHARGDCRRRRRLPGRGRRRCPRPRPRRCRPRYLRPLPLCSGRRAGAGGWLRRGAEPLDRRRRRHHHRRGADGAGRPEPRARLLRLRLAQLRRPRLRQLAGLPAGVGGADGGARRPPGDRVLRAGPRLERATADRRGAAGAAVLVPVRARGTGRLAADGQAAPAPRRDAAGRRPLVGLRHRPRPTAAGAGRDRDGRPRPDRPGGQPLVPQGRVGDQPAAGCPAGPDRGRGRPPAGDAGPGARRARSAGGAGRRVHGGRL